MHLNLKCYLGDRYPEITGTSSSPMGDWDCKKIFAAGNHFSTDAVFNQSSINKQTAGALDLKTGWELIPDTPEVRAAGYTDQLLANAAVWYGPTSDGENYYYCAFGGNLFSATVPSILVARRIVDNSLVYARSCNNFSTSGLILCRVAPALWEDTIYITSSLPLPNGPELYAINKSDGTLRWRLPYYPSENGQNLRTGDSNIIVYKGLITCGSASFQNTDFNIGVRQGGFPIYTDQGFLFTVKDEGTHGRVVNSYGTCPPLLKVNQTLVKGGDPRFDPFLPGFDYTVIGTISVDSPVSMYQFGSDELPLPPGPITILSSPIAVTVRFSPTNPPALTQPIWNAVDTLYTTNAQGQTVSYDSVSALLAALTAQGTGTRIVWAYLDETQQGIVQNQPGNGGLYYYKRINNGETVQNEFDAQGLNFWGNSVWGAPPSGICGKVYFGSGQTHAMPFFDRYIYFLQPDNYNVLRDNLDAATQGYVAGTVTLVELNAIKDNFVTEIRLQSQPGGIPRSPRGELNFADAISRATLYQPGLDFSIRTMPLDVYSFLTQDPDFLLVGLVSNADADMSSGVQLYPDINRVAGINKGGIGAIIDLCPTPTYAIAQYTGPNGIIGGTNYQSTSSLSDKIYAVNAAGDIPPKQIMVTRSGQVIHNSFMLSLNVSTGVVEWDTELFGKAAAGTAMVNGVLLTLDLASGFYGIDAFNGDMLWYYNNSDGQYPSKGGTAAPCVIGKYIIWCPNYAVPTLLPGGFGKWGLTFTVNRSLVHDPCDDDLPCGTYVSNNVSGVTTSQRWKGNTAAGRIVVGGMRGAYTLTVDDSWRIGVEGSNLCFSNLRWLTSDSYAMSVRNGKSIQTLIFKKK